MKSTKLTLAVALALLAPTLALGAPSGADSEMRAQLEALKAQVAQIDAMKAQIAALEQKLAANEAAAKAAAKTTATMAAVQDDVDDLDKRLTKAERHSVVDAIERLVDAYLTRREAPEERFIDAFRRLGAAPFKEALYGTA